MTGPHVPTSEASTGELIVGGVLFALAGLAALSGKMRVGRVAEPPRERVESVKADFAAARHGATS
jgi:hypothetical protein